MKTLYSFVIAMVVFTISSAWAQIPEIKSQNTIGVRSDSYLHSVHETLVDSYIMDGTSPLEISIDKIAAFIPSSPANNLRELTPINDSIYTWGWNTLTNGWEDHANWRETNIVYDANNNLISFIDQEWNGSTWVNTEKNIYSYDAKNNQTSYLSQTWNGGTWENEGLTTYAYDAENNQLSSLGQYWNDSIWVNNVLNTYTYDASNNKTTALAKWWNGYIWLDWTLDTYTYDINNNLISSLAQLWSDYYSSWRNSYLSTNSYDGNNNRTSHLFQTWSSSTWVNYSLSTYSYNGNNLCTSVLGQHWDGGAWVNESLSTNSYDANNNWTSEIYQYWDGYAWMNESLYTLHYDGNNFLESYAFKEFNGVTTSIIYGDSAHIYFHVVEIGIDELMATDGCIAVYPNPVRDVITFDPSNLTTTQSEIFIYNSSGVLLKHLSSMHSTQVKIPVDDIGSDGMYFYTLRTDDQKFFAGKFIIQR